MRRLLISILAVALMLCPKALIGDEIEEQYQRCIRLGEAYDHGKAEVEAEEKRLARIGQALAAKRLLLEEDERLLARLRQSVDYSRYDRCPNDESWSSCGHTDLKDAWLREQLGRLYRSRVNRSELEQAEALYQQRLRRYQRDQELLRQAHALLMQEIRKLREMVNEENFQTARSGAGQRPAMGLGDGEGNLRGSFPDAAGGAGRFRFGFLVRNPDGTLPMWSGTFEARRLERRTDADNPQYTTEVWSIVSPELGDAEVVLRGGQNGAAGTARGWEVQAYDRTIRLEFSVQLSGDRIRLHTFHEHAAADR